MVNFPNTALPTSAFPTGRQEQPVAFRPNTDSELQTRDSDSSVPPRFVYRGEILEELNNQDRRYRPQYNQDIDPQNRQAIGSYQQIDNNAVSDLDYANIAAGRIVDFFI